MLRRLALAVLVAALGSASADAGPRAPVPSDAAAQFDALVAGTKKAMMADPKTALAAARRATALAESWQRSGEQQEAVATGLWLESEALTRSNRIAEARAALDRAIAIASADHKPTKLDGDLALSLARAARTASDIPLSLKSLQKAYGIFDALHEARGQSMALQGLGVIYQQARDFPRAIDYFARAAEVYSDDRSLRLSIANNMALAFQDAGRFAESLKQYRSALAEARALKSPFLEARILTNIAFTETKVGDLRAAAKAVGEAQKLLGRTSDSDWAPFIWGVKAEIDFERGDWANASADLDRAFAGVDLTTTILPFRDMHQIAYKIYRTTGAFTLALAHLEAYKRLDDEARSLAASANLALMNARFEFANQKLEIATLKTEQLRRDASFRESRAATQRLMLLSLVSAALGFIIWMAWRHRLLREHRDVISKANVELTRILGERDDEIGRRVETETHLRDAILAAEQANRAKTKFLANMSHELRTPLNAIIGFSEIIASGALPPAKTQEYSADINLSGRKLLAIFGDILDTARLDAGSVILSEEELVLGQCVDSAVARVSKLVNLAERTIVTAGDRKLRVRGDAQRLTQIVEKLLSNAVKFTTAKGRIEIAFGRASGGGADLVVSDDGEGIASEHMENIMERFGQVESAYARSHGGIGLGLPIVKSLVMLHDGTLSIQSEPGKGTSVCVHLPAERVLDRLSQDATVAA